MELARGRPELAELEALDAEADDLPGVLPELDPLRACAPSLIRFRVCFCIRVSGLWRPVIFLVYRICMCL